MYLSRAAETPPKNKPGMIELGRDEASLKRTLTPRSNSVWHIGGISCILFPSTVKTRNDCKFVKVVGIVAKSL